MEVEYMFAIVMGVVIATSILLIIGTEVSVEA